VDTERAYWHVTFHPYRRSAALWDEVESYFYELLEDVARRMGFEVVRVVAMPEHVHLLLEKPPWLDLRKVVAQVKGYTARRILERYPDLRVDMRSSGFWAPGNHYVRHTAASLPAVLAYISGQKVKGGLE